jgi:PAS domain S-box-containing protein
MDNPNLSRDKVRTRRGVLDQRRAHADTRRTLTVVPPSDTQERLENIFRAAPIGMGLLRDRCFVEFNDRFREMVGYDREELLGQSTRIICPTEEEYDRVRAVMSRQIAETGTGCMETQCLCKDGRLIHVLLRCSSLDPADPGSGVIFTAMDVTAAKETEARLRDSEEQYRLLVEYSPDAICIQCDGRICFANQAALRLVGAVDPDQVIGRSVLDMVHPDHHDIVKTRMEAIQNKRTALPRHELKCVRLNGHHMDVEVIAAPITYQGKPAAQFIVHDVTEQKRAEQRLRVQHELSIDLSSVREMGHAIARIFEAIRSLSEIDCYGLYMIDPATGELNLAFHQGLSAEFIRSVSHFASDSPNAVAVKAGAPIYGLFSDIRSSEGVLLDREGLHAAAVIPILYDGQVVAVLTLASHTQEELSAEVKTTLEIIAAEAGGTIARIRAEQALRESEAMFRAIATVSPAAIAILRSDAEYDRFFYVNPAWEAMSGYSQSEAMTLRPSDLSHPDIRAQTLRHAKTRIRGGTAPLRYDHRVVKRNGDTLYLDMAATRIHYQGTPAILTVALDVTERKAAENALAAASRQWQGTFDSVSDVIWLLDRDFRICRANNATARLFHKTPEEVQGRQCWEIVHGSTASMKPCPVCRLRETHSRQRTELRIGSSWHEIIVDPILDASGQFDGVVHIISDITEHKKTEEKLRSLASELSLAEERERRRIAANLHDYACQGLALAKMQLQSVLESPRPDKSVLQPICSRLQETIDSIREMTFDLSSATLYKFGLEAALEELLADKLSRSRPIRYRFSTDQTPKPLTEETSVLLFQCVRELLINVIKHARAKHVTVEIACEGDHIRILVADDGVGFNPDAMLSSTHRTHSVGLFFVRERLDYAGGTLQIKASPGRGSRFILTAPLNKRAESMKENEYGREDSAGR